MKEKISDLFADTPEMIETGVEMSEANAAIPIYEGDLLIRHPEVDINATGKVFFQWFPQTGAHFIAEPKAPLKTLNQVFNDARSIKLIINELEFGDAYLSEIHTDFGGSTTITGVMIQQAVWGDKSIPVEKIRFALPNFRDFYGLNIKRITPENNYGTKGRIILDNEHFNIILDKSYKFKELKKSLEGRGGYVLLYSGELVPKSGNLTFQETRPILYCLSIFLSFLNGRSVSPLFVHGIVADQTIWIDYTDYHSEPFKEVRSWPTDSIIGLNELWQRFATLWKQEKDKDFLIKLIQWYVHANGNTSFPEASIIMTQAILELIYNWWIVENKRLLVGKDSEDISASNKIRLVLAQLDIPSEVPEGFPLLRKLVEDSKELSDAPDAITQIRNAIIHSQEEKRKKLSKMDERVKRQTLNLSLWYIEMSLLRILYFDGKFDTRRLLMPGMPFEQYVPWANVKRN